MNKKTKKLLIFSILIVIIAVIFFVTIKSKTKNVKGNIISPTEYHEITDSQLKENKEKEKSTAKVIIYWSMNDEKSLELLKLFNEFYTTYSSSIIFTAVNLEDNATKSAVYLNNNNINIPNTTTSNISINGINEKEIEEFPTFAFILKDGSLLAYVNGQETIQEDGTKTEFTIENLNKDSIEAYLDILSENY